MTSTLLGFDYGTRRIGVAVGQKLTHSATALVTLPTRGNKPDWEAITRLIQEWQPGALVVGVPLGERGEQPVTRAARRFSLQLGQRYGLPVYTVDERLSSHAAERASQKGKRRASQGRLSVAGGRRPGATAGRQPAVDHIAAQVILQTWLDETRAR